MNKRKVKKAIKRLTNLPRGKYFFLYIFNKVYHLFLKTVKSTRVAYPSTIMMELTNHCNLECTTCPREYDYGRSMDKGRMDVESAKKIIDEVWPYLDSIGLTGMGETFLYNDIKEIVDYIKKKNKGIIISVSTNAVLPNFIERVDDLLGQIDTIQVSIDGLYDVYNQIRLKSDFRILDNNLRILSKKAAKSDTDIMLNMVVTKENYMHMPLLVEYAQEIKVEYLDFTLFNLASVTDIEQSYYSFYQSSEFNYALNELEETISNTPDVIVTKRKFSTDNSFQKCSFPWTHFYICWDGYIAPCCAKPFPKELNFGNVFNTNVIDVLNSDSYQRFRQLWFKNISPEFCNKCHFINIEPIKQNSK
ncbi:radical SAM protein [Carboxylicivirga marina]|uniref:radical SAM protein n=1 Tax=Carboxylicivirga marina TaxID=2800988 RepID=UPI002593690D|nr:radical SAM protein [uncultured Carboxylicivirga sp.]